MWTVQIRMGIQWNTNELSIIIIASQNAVGSINFSLDMQADKSLDEGKHLLLPLNINVLYLKINKSCLGHRNCVPLLGGNSELVGRKRKCLLIWYTSWTAIGIYSLNVEKGKTGVICMRDLPCSLFCENEKTAGLLRHAFSLTKIICRTKSKYYLYLIRTLRWTAVF